MISGRKRMFAAEVLAGPLALGHGLATVEALPTSVDSRCGAAGNSTRARRRTSHPHPDLRASDRDVDSGSGWIVGRGALWPTPHSRLFDFAATSAAPNGSTRSRGSRAHGCSPPAGRSSATAIGGKSTLGSSGTWPPRRCVRLGQLVLSATSQRCWEPSRMGFVRIGQTQRPSTGANPRGGARAFIRRL